ncbi:hypothetical protein SAMN05421756_11361 [Microlunatus flavus]|uniref:Tox-REase-7 domain-containing protein n=2 Tax=Microlunatus flavus TaxID=1036181 RepID=A0A1H9NBM9_9ACTN|nr:hypothetical protein SAMN05421756_11361 [Microlunatus flavus]
MSERAFTYQSHAEGARSSVERGRSEAPALEYTRENGKAGRVRFDGVDEGTMIDRKLSIYSSKKTENQIRRQSRAAEQNGMDVRWEVPTRKEADRATRLFARVGASNMTVIVVPE